MAEYETADNKLNQVKMFFKYVIGLCLNQTLFLQVVLWDKIIQRGENGNLNLKNMNTNYYFWDDGNGLRGNPNITLTLSWNVIPNAGTLSIIKGAGSHSFSFPNEYTNVRAQ